MDEDEEYASEREELLNRFRESLSKPVSERFFDEDDLIEIFDYAGDLNDDYLRMEALLCGARYFPDSEQLLSRRGIFYSQYSDEARSSFLEHSPSHDNLILKTLYYRSNPPQPGTEKEVLDQLLSSQEILGDEDVIQLIALAGSLRELEWVKDNMPQLRKKVQYINVLLYEVSNVAETMADYDFAIEMMDELTEIEPFNSFYWTSLARINTEKGDYERAVNSIDYALAINPDSPLPLLGKAKLFYAMERPLAEVEECAQQALAASDHDIDCLRFLATVMMERGKAEQAQSLLREGIYQGSASNNAALTSEDKYRAVELVPEIILSRPADIDQLLDRFYLSNEENPQVMWASWAQQLSSQGFGDVSRKVIECFQRNSGIQILTSYTIEDAFNRQEFQTVIDQLEDYLKTLGADESDFPILMTMHLVSLVKLGLFAKASSLCQYIIKNVNIGKHDALNTRIEYFGLMSLTHIIINKISKSTNPLDWTDFDPMLCWKK